MLLAPLKSASGRPIIPAVDNPEPIYRLRRTVLAFGAVYEAGLAGRADDFGDLFHPFRTAGYLETVLVNNLASFRRVTGRPLVRDTSHPGSST